MINLECATLTIWKEVRAGVNYYTFNLHRPDRVRLIGGQTPIPTANEEGIKDAITAAAENMLSQASEGLASLKKLGRLLYVQLPQPIRTALVDLKWPVLVDAHGDPTIPWELCHDDKEFLFVRAAVGRLPDSVLEDAPEAVVPAGERPACLIIAPSLPGDLQGASAEARELEAFLRGQGADVVPLVGEQATYLRASTELQNRPYHIIHICGHAQFDSDNNPVIVLAGGGLLTAREIQVSLQGTPFVFANTCVSSRVEVRAQRLGMPAYYAEVMGLPFAFMNAEAGRACAFVGSPWRVEDLGARELSLAFYRAFFAGRTAGEALREARQEVRQRAGNVTWASFILWGAPTLDLMRAAAPAQPAQAVPVAAPVEPAAAAPAQPAAALPEPVAAAPVAPLLEEGRLNRKRLAPSGREAFHHAELEMALTGADFVTSTYLFIGLTKTANGATQQGLRHQAFNPEDTRDVLRQHALEQVSFFKMFANLASGLGEDAAPQRAQGGESFDPSETVKELLQFADALARAGDPRQGLVEERHLLLGFLKQGGGTTREVLEGWGIDLPALQAYAEGRPGAPAQHPLFDAGGTLRAELLAPDARRVLDWAWREAGRGTASYLATPYFLEALCVEGAGFASALRAQGRDVATVRASVHRTLHGDAETEQPPAPDRPPFQLADLSRRVQNILRGASEEARAETSPVITERHLVLGFLGDGGGSAGYTLRQAGTDLRALETCIRTRPALPPQAPSAPPAQAAQPAPAAPSVLPASPAPKYRGGAPAQAGAAAPGPEAGTGVVDRVHFTVTAPPIVRPRASFVVSLWAHLEQQRGEVLSRARQMHAGPEPMAVTQGAVRLERGTELTVKLDLEDLVIAEPEDTLLWDGDIGSVTFAVKVLEGAADGPRAGTASIYAGGLRVARVHFVLHVGQADAEAETVPSREERPRKAFVSYASADRDEVLGRIQGMQKIARELEVFLDVVSLRAGQYWERELWTAIPQHDVFYLFWSQAASRSEWVRREWQCALKTRGLDFIDPVPLVSPDDVPPPPELSGKHFNDWVLAFMRGGHGGQPRTHVTAGAPKEEAPKERMPAEPAPDAPFAPDGRLAAGYLTETASGVLQGACVAAGHTGSEAGIAHLVLALLQTPAAGLWGAALAQQGFDPEQVREQLRGAAAPVPPGPEVPVESRACTAALRGLLTHALRAAAAEGATAAGERHLVLGLLAQHDDRLVGQFAKAGLDFARAEAALRSHPLFDADGRLTAERLSPVARQALEESAGGALRTGYAMVGTPHLLMGLLFVPGGRLRPALDRSGVSAQRVLDAVAAALGGAKQGSRIGIDVVQSAFSPRALEILRLAQEAADRSGSGLVGEEHLLQGFLAGVDGVTRTALERCGATPALLAQALAGSGEAAPAGTGAPAGQALRMETPAAAGSAGDMFLPDGTLNRPLFGESALRALAGAEATARQLNHAMIGSPHLLVGLTLVPDGAACASLQAQGLTPDVVQRAMFSAFPAGAQPPPREARLAYEGCSANLRRILALAREVTRRRGAAQVDEPALFEAFLLDGGGQAGRVLQRLGFGGSA